MSDETSTVSVQVLDILRLVGRGRLVALAQVEIIVDGVEFMTQGWRVLRRSDGMVTVEPPCYRHADGDLVPALVVPVELEDAIARAIVAELAPPAPPRRVLPGALTIRVA